MITEYLPKDDTVLALTIRNLFCLCQAFCVLSRLALDTDLFQILNFSVFFGLVKAKSSVLRAYHDILTKMYYLSFGSSLGLSHMCIVPRIINAPTMIVTIPITTKAKALKILPSADMTGICLSLHKNKAKFCHRRATHFNNPLDFRPEIEPIATKD